MTLKDFSRFIRSIFLLIYIFTFPLISWAQLLPEKVEHITFSNRINNPLKIEVLRQREQYEFFATNDSYYPCLLEIEFTQLMNVNPPKARYSQVVSHGKTRLFTLAPHIANQSINYSYKYKYTLGDPDAKPDPTHPYLIPIAEGSKVAFNQYIGLGRGRNNFSMSESDTVYAMRKGIITALPSNFIPVDRLSEGSLEILHADGTVAVYENLDPESVFVKLGNKVYAGAPLGLMRTPNPLAVNVFTLSESTTGGTMIKSFIYKYAIDDTTTVPSSHLREGVLVKHPQSIIEKEMTKGEIKRSKKTKKGN